MLFSSLIAFYFLAASHFFTYLLLIPSLFSSKSYLRVIFSIILVLIVLYVWNHNCCGYPYCYSWYFHCFQVNQMHRLDVHLIFLVV